MKKLIKIVAGVSGALVVLVFAAPLIVTQFVDPNDYKPEITRAVKERTGRDLLIEGDIALSFFPWLALDLGRAGLGNAPGFDEPWFARFERVRVRVKLLPLLRKELQMDTVKVEGLRLNLARSGDGTANWDDLMGAGAAPAADDGTGVPPLAALAVGGIEIEDAEIGWHDAAAGQRYRVSGLDVHTGALALNEPVSVRTSFAFAGGAPPLDGEVTLEGVLALDVQGQSVRADGVAVDARLRGEAVPGGEARIGLTTNAGYDGLERLVSLDELRLETEGLALQGAGGRFVLEGRLRANLATRVIDAGDLRLEGEVTGAAIPGGSLALGATGSVRADLNTGNAAVTGMQVTLPRLQLEGAEGRLSVNADVAADLNSRRFFVTGLKAKGMLSGAAVPGGSAVFDVGADLNANLQAQRFAARGLTVAGTLSGADLPGGELPFALAANTVLDSPAAQLAVSDLRVSIGGLEASGSVAAGNLFAEPALSGDLKVARFDLRALLERLGRLPETADPKALTAAALETSFSASPNDLKLDPLSLELDGTRVTGSVEVKDIARRALVFDLSADALDADRYLPAGGGAATPGAAGAAAGGLPLDTLRGLDLDGKLRLGRLSAAKLQLSDVRLGVLAREGLIEVKPLRAGLYGGSYTGHVLLDARRDDPTLSLDEAVKGIHAARLLEDLQVDTGGLDLSGGTSDLAVRAQARINPDTATYHFENMSVSANLAGKSFPGGRLGFGMGADVALNPGEGSLRAEKMLVVVGDPEARGKLSVAGLTAEPRYQTTLETEPFNPKALLQQFGREPPRTMDPKALTAAEFSARVTGSPTRIAIEDLKLLLDDSTVEGNLFLDNFEPLVTRFDLSVDGIDVDRYRPPGSKQAAATPGAAATQLPAKTLKFLQADGQLRVGAMKVSNLIVNDLRVTATAKDGITRLHPLNARLYEGTYSGNVVVDATESVPRIGLDEKLAGIDTGPLLNDLTGSAPLRGTANAAARLTMRGADAGAIKRTLSGEAAVQVTNGVIKGADIAYSLCQGMDALTAASGASSLNLQSLLLGAAKVAAGSTRKKQDGTRFSELEGTVVITNGVARNDDFVLRSPAIRVTGAGSVDLPKDHIDYLAKAALAAGCQGGASYEEFIGVPMEVHVKGPTSGPKIIPKLGHAFDALRERSKQRQAQQQQQLQQQQAVPDDPKELLKGLLEGQGLGGLLGN